MVNQNPTTGIAFGYIRADAIDSDLLHEITLINGKDLTYEGALAEYLAQQRTLHECSIDEGEIEPDEEFDENAATDKFNDECQCDEPIYEGEHEGVKYRTSWLGGAQHLWVFESPVVTKCRPCSPCVPGAGNLENVGDYEAYGVPTSWLTPDFIEQQIERDDYCVVMGPDSKEYWMVKGNDHGVMHGPFGDRYLAAEDCYQKRLQRKL